MWMGIDGGGSNLRIVVVDVDMAVLAQASAGAVNPVSVGKPIARKRISDAIGTILQSVDRDKLTAVGIGIAGAEADREADWLTEVLGSSLPDVPVIPSSDHEIALVGAQGKREGLLLLAGTGSIALGINADGLKLQKGGWGYRFGDEGSGYWLGLHALKAVAFAYDGLVFPASDLAERIRDELAIRTRKEILDWVYNEETDPARIAGLAPLVLKLADEEDPYSLHLVEQAAAYLDSVARSMLTPLGLSVNDVAFAGGLLESDNALSRQLVKRLGLKKHPVPLYSPAMGAALLAKLTAE